MNEQIDVEKTLVHGTEEELNALKSFLFQENIRLEIERQAQQDKEKSLLALEEDLEKRKQQFIQDKFTFQKESDILKHRMTTERQKLTQDNLFFDLLNETRNLYLIVFLLYHHLHNHHHSL